MQSGAWLAFGLTRSDCCKGSYARIIAEHGNISVAASLKYFATN